VREVARTLGQEGLLPRDRIEIAAHIDGAAIRGIEGDVGVLDDRVLVDDVEEVDVEIIDEEDDGPVIAAREGVDGKVPGQDGGKPTRIVKGCVVPAELVSGMLKPGPGRGIVVALTVIAIAVARPVAIVTPFWAVPIMVSAVMIVVFPMMITIMMVVVAMLAVPAETAIVVPVVAPIEIPVLAPAVMPVEVAAFVASVVGLLVTRALPVLIVVTVRHRTLLPRCCFGVRSDIAEVR
jgi:hypothetical protein